MLAILIGIAAGAASTAQASVNGRIREDYRSPYLTAVLSFVIAGIILAFIILFTEHDLSIPFGDIAKYPFWIWLGGCCGAAIITLNVVCLPYLGSARNVMIICFGQTMAGLLIDHAGLFGSPVVKMSLTRTAGAVLVIAGAALVNGIRLSGNSSRESGPGRNVLPYIILAGLNGFACAAQVAVNGSLNTAVGSASKATLVSMSVGLITTLILIAMLTAVKGRMAIYDGGIRGTGLIRGFRPWMAAGGALSIIVVGGNAVTAPMLGTGIVTILNLIGMMGAGLIIDAVGFLGIEKKPATPAKMIGMLLMIAGTAVISLI